VNGRHCQSSPPLRGMICASGVSWYRPENKMGEVIYLSDIIWFKEPDALKYLLVPLGVEPIAIISRW
jgi:hypothetical protein